MAKASKVKKSGLLSRRLQEALDNGSQVHIEADESFSGIPIYLDSEFVEIITIVPPDEFDEGDDEYRCMTWLIQLSSIFAIGYPSQSWSKERLDNLLKKEAIPSDSCANASESED